MDILTELANTLNYWVASLWQFLQTEPLVSKVMDILCVTLPLSFLLAFAGLGFLSGTARVLAVIRKRSSYEKCSHQLALFSVLLGWALLVCTRVWLFHIQSSDVPDSLPNFLLEIGWMLLGMAVSQRAYVTRSPGHLLWALGPAGNCCCSGCSTALYSDSKSCCCRSNS